MLFWPPSFSRIIVAQHFCKTQTHRSRIAFVVWTLSLPWVNQCIAMCLWDLDRSYVQADACHVEITGNGREMQIKATCVVPGSTSGVSWQREAIVVGKRWKLRLFRLTNVRSVHVGRWYISTFKNHGCVCCLLLNETQSVVLADNVYPILF